MDWNSGLAMAVAIGFFVVGILGSFLPILPGSVIAWAGIVLHRLWLGDESVSWAFVGIATAIMLLTQVVEYVTTVWGAKWFGAGWKGAAGALLGGIVGLFFGLPGIILGPIAGAALFEFVDHRDFRRAGKAGIGTVVGGLLALAVKLGLTVAMVIWFFVALPGERLEALPQVRESVPGTVLREGFIGTGEVRPLKFDPRCFDG